jgi:hypothetical protein
LNFDIIADSTKLDNEIAKNFYFSIVNLYYNPNMTLKFIIKFITYIPEYYYRAIQGTGLIKITDINAYPIFNKDLEYNPNLTINYLLLVTQNWQWVNTIALKYLSLMDLDILITKFSKFLIGNYYIAQNINLTYDFVYKYSKVRFWDSLILSRHEFPAEVSKERTVNKIKTNYLNHKKQMLLNKYMISDLNNIIIEY